jgi:hypothetical protein
MQLETETSSQSKTALYTGYALSVLFILFMLMDGVMKFSNAAPVVQTMQQLEIPATLTPALGVITLVSLALYIMPATSVLGAILFTGYLGGAIAIHARVGNPIFTHILFPIYVALFMWGGIWFRDYTLRDLFPVVKNPASSAPSKALLYTGYVVGALAALFVLFSAVMKFVYVPPAGAPPPGFPMQHIHTLAYIEFALVALYLFPRTTFFGAVFLTGYLGGATAVDLRSGESIGGALVPTIIGIALWAGYWLRNAQVRSLIPFRNK